jgi:hypothetical protein
MAAPGSTTSHKKNDYRLLMDCWWNVLVHMISELLFQEERPALPPPSWGLVEQQPSFSWEALAVSLLDLLQLLLACHRQLGVSSTWRRINPEGLHDWVVPLPTPEALLWMHASLANTVTTTCTTTSGSTKSGVAVEDDQGGLTAGGKILLRLGLYRILMLEQRTDLIADDEEQFQY